MTRVRSRIRAPSIHCTPPGKLTKSSAFHILGWVRWLTRLFCLCIYLDSTREVGLEKAQLKVEVERLGRPNSFTSSFNGFRYRDFGLNTAITKSKICDQLDLS